MWIKYDLKADHISPEMDLRSFRCSGGGFFFFQLWSRDGSILRGWAPAFLFPCWNPLGTSAVWSPRILLFKTRGYGPGWITAVPGCWCHLPASFLLNSPWSSPSPLGRLGWFDQYALDDDSERHCLSMHNVTQVTLIWTWKRLRGKIRALAGTHLFDCVVSLEICEFNNINDNKRCANPL